MSDIEKSSVSPVAASNDPGTKGEVIDVSNKDGIHDDLGRELFEQSLQYSSAQLELDSIKVQTKLDFIVLPMVRISPSNCLRNDNGTDHSTR
jgi:hypothetical protein